MKRALLGFSLLLLLPMVWPRLALADADDDAAAQAFAAATKYFQQKDYLRAIAEFQRAYKLRPLHQVQCSIARCHENLNQVVEAAEHYRRCLREGAEQTAMRARIQASLKAVEARISWVDVVGSEGGTLYVDGLPAGLTPRRQALNPGRHVLEVRREGWRSARAVVETLGGEQRSVTLKIEKLGEPSVVTPPVVPATAPATAPEPETPPRGRRHLSQAWFWTAAGLSAALAGAAIALGVLSINARSDYESNPTKDGLDRFLQRRMITNVLWGLAGAAAVSGTVLFFFTDFRGEGSRREVSAGLGLGGRF
jgi:hypothetical protein